MKRTSGTFRWTGCFLIALFPSGATCSHLAHNKAVNSEEEFKRQIMWLGNFDTFGQTGDVAHLLFFVTMYAVRYWGRKTGRIWLQCGTRVTGTVQLNTNAISGNWSGPQNLERREIILQPRCVRNCSFTCQKCHLYTKSFAPRISKYLQILQKIKCFIVLGAMWLT